jgi:hypothetical protein
MSWRFNGGRGAIICDVCSVIIAEPANHPPEDVISLCHAHVNEPIIVPLTRGQARALVCVLRRCVSNDTTADLLAERAVGPRADIFAPLLHVATVASMVAVYDGQRWSLQWKRRYHDGVSDARVVDNATLAGAVADAVEWEMDNDRREPPPTEER